jgi:hypothetical protein
MKKMMFLPITLIAALALIVTWAWSSNASGEEKREAVALPDSCTLMSMKPADRVIHVERLGMLRRSAKHVKVSPEGFSFEVDLGLMPVRDLQGWAENVSSEWVW